MVRGETDKKAANIQTRSFMARTLDEIGKKCPAEGEAKVVTRIYFIDPDQECSQEIGNTNGSCSALQDEQEE